jgi:hypothetical protein
MGAAQRTAPVDLAEALEVGGRGQAAGSMIYAGPAKF